MSLKLDLRGFDQVPLFRDQLRKYIVAWAAIFKRRVREKTPVDKGFLKSRWSVRSAGIEGINIVNDAGYAVFVEEGTSKMAPRRMLARTIEEAELISKEAAEKVGLP